MIQLGSTVFDRSAQMLRDSAGCGQKMQEAELAYLMSSEAAQTMLAENYVGLRG